MALLAALALTSCKQSERQCAPAASASAPAGPPTASISGKPNFDWEVKDGSWKDPPVVLETNKDTLIAEVAGFTCTGRVSNTANDQGVQTQYANVVCKRGDEAVEVGMSQREGEPFERGVPLGITRGGKQVVSLSLAPRMRQ
jgi:hypothetical protein